MRTAKQLALMAIVFVSLASATSASAAIPSEFGIKGSGAGEFEEPRGIAVFQETGDVYLGDLSNSRVDSFGPEGAFRFAVGWGVADGENKLEVCTSECRAGISGSGAGQFQFGSPDRIAVDNDPRSASYGDFYVVDARNHRVEKFDSEGHFLLTFGKGVNLSTKGSVCTAAESANCGEGEISLEEGGFSFGIGGVAVGSTGVVYVGDSGRVEEFTPAGQFTSQVEIGGGAGSVKWLGVNEAGEIDLIAEGVPGVRRYGQFGAESGAPLDAEGSAESMTLGPNGEIFVDDGSGGNTTIIHLLEFDPSGAEVKSFDLGREGAVGGIAFGATIKRIYVVDQEVVRLVSIPPAGPFTFPGTEKVTDPKPNHAGVSALIDAEGSPTTYRYEYGETEAYGQATTPVALSEEGGLFAAEAAPGDLTGLQPNTLYHFRTVAENEAGETTFGPDTTFTTPPPVGLSGESATQVTPEGARLNVEINPQGAATVYHYEYGLSTEYEESVPVPDAEAGADEVSASHSIVIEHLHPGTVYHYRVVATNTFGTVQGSGRVFTTTTAPGGTVLADGRVWEMVSPPSKHGASLEAISEEGGLIESSENGEALTYFGTGPLGSEAEPEGSQNIADSQFVARRTAPGAWETEDITTPHDRPAGFHPGGRSEYLFFSSDLESALVEPFGATPLSSEATERTPYVREASGGFTPLVTPGNVPAETKFGGEEAGGGDYAGGLQAVGATPDLTSAAIVSPLALTGDFTSKEANGTLSLYLWSHAARSLQLVSWLPATEEVPHETPAALAGDETSLGFRDDLVRHAISKDGNRVVYSTRGPSNETHVFIRDMGLGKSAQLDLLESGISGGGLAQFQDASADGKVVYFTDEERLTADATSNQNEGTPDLYRCVVEEVAEGLKCTPENITVPVGSREASDVLGTIIGADENGGLVYFVANGRLTSNASRGDCPHSSASGSLPPASTTCNLYVYDAASKETRLVAVLSGRDFPDWAAQSPNNLMWLTARVSPNGRYLAFMSQRSLTGYDNRDAHSGAPDAEVFEYDSESSQLACVSCSRTNARPDGVLDTGAFPGLLVDRPDIWANQWIAATVPGWTGVRKTGPPAGGAYQSRYLDDNGRLFFNSNDNLVPADVNGQFDVYEYEPAGIGSCGLESGCVALMSSGLDAGESTFLDSASEGEDVFFMTAAKLSPVDTDSLRDVYDARVCSGSDCPANAGGVPPPCGTSDACRAAPSPQPDSFGAPSSSTFSGAGNLAPPAASVVVKAKPLTRARLLANALKACHKDRARKQRVSCGRKARKRYGPPHKARKAGYTITTRKGGK
jgi:hypothetical protein